MSEFTVRSYETKTQNYDDSATMKDNRCSIAATLMALVAFLSIANTFTAYLEAQEKFARGELLRCARERSVDAARNDETM